jgi:heme exporter protein C
MQKYANPTVFLRLANAVLPVVWTLAVVAFGAGLYGALFNSPADYQQGETVRIMYVHVPSAWLAMMAYGVMALASAAAIIFRHPLADVAAKCASPLGAVFCFLALATGSIWGKPMWGAWWVWDARLTSMFILMLLYLGYISVWQAIDDPARAAAIARIVALVGAVNLPIIKFSVDWWNSLHQPASVFRMGGPTIDKSMLWPLLVMGIAYTLLFVALHLTLIRAELAARKLRNMQMAATGSMQ